METVYFSNLIGQYCHQAKCLEVKEFIYSIISSRVIKCPGFSITYHVPALSGYTLLLSDILSM